MYVSDPPEIEVERGWVHSGEGYEAQLVCIVHAEPPAEVSYSRVIIRKYTLYKSYQVILLNICNLNLSRTKRYNNNLQLAVIVSWV